MSAQRALLTCLAVATVGCPCTTEKEVESALPVSAIRSYPRTEQLSAADRLAVIGDVQRTSVWGRMVLAESNLAEQHYLVDDLAKREFRGLILLGDMVFSSGDDNWAYFDELMAPLRSGQVAASSSGPASSAGLRYFFPVMGNHDYMGKYALVTHQLNQRFPGFLERTHYAFDWHHVRMIVLDGNRTKLCPNPGFGAHACQAEWQAQLTWLRQELREVDRAPAAEQRGALLFVHQSPYTQSPLVAGDQADARDFANELFASERGLALISAHAHGFERYEYRRDGSDQRPAKVFIVSAGGGGPRPHWRRPGAPPDLSALPWPRPFNYLLLEQDATTVQVHVRGLEKDQRVVAPIRSENVSLEFR